MKSVFSESFAGDSITLPPGIRYGMRFTSMPPETEPVLHYHDHYEVFYCLSGSIVYMLGGKQYRLEPGNLLLIAPYELHCPCIREGFSYERVSIRFDAEILERLSVPSCDLSECFHMEEEKENVLFLVEPEHQEELLFLCRGFLREYTLEGWGKEVAEHAWLTQVFLFINRLAQRRAGAPALVSPSLQRIQRVVEYLEKNYSGPISMDELGKKFYIDRAHLSREFKRIVGCSPHHYLMQKRLMHAQCFLCRGVPPEQAARQSGFSDYTNFYRQFRNVYGMGPREYQKNICSLLEKRKKEDIL